jgi:hypothetical protein
LKVLIYVTEFVCYKLQVRTKLEPTRWPIIEPSKQFLSTGQHLGVGMIVPGQGMGAVADFAPPPSTPIHPVPPPPLPANINSFPLPSDPLLTADVAELQNGLEFHNVGENLNPDVPEFVPVTVRCQGENGHLNSAETERSDSEQQCEELEIRHKGTWSSC